MEGKEMKKHISIRHPQQHNTQYRKNNIDALKTIRMLTRWVEQQGQFFTIVLFLQDDGKNMNMEQDEEVGEHF